jgi:hypothetical protein
LNIYPTQRDDNGHALMGHGSEVITKRFTSIGTGGQAISLGIDVKEVLVHIEGSIEKVRFTGTADASEEIIITQDGVTLEHLPIVAPANQEIITVAAPTGMVNVSVMGWR